MTDRDVVKRGGGSDSSGHDGSPLPTSEESNPRQRPKQILDSLQSFEFESENDDGNQTPESQVGKASKGVSDIFSSSEQQLDKAARRRICGDHDDPPLPISQESTPNPNNPDLSVPESLRSYDFHPEPDNNGPTDHGIVILLNGFVYSLQSSDTAEIVVSILESWHTCKSPEGESLVTRLFTLEEYERMSYSRCRQKPNYPEQSSYGIVVAADSIRDLNCAFGDIKFEDILKMIRIEDKMLCDIKTGSCGKANFAHHIISRCPPIFTVVLEWEKHETEKEISETTKALDWEIDMSRLYERLEPNTKYRLVSMVGCGEDEQHICLAYEKEKWVGVRHDAFTEEAVGNWESLIRFCGERKVRPKILFYEAAH